MRDGLTVKHLTVNGLLAQEVIDIIEGEMLLISWDYKREWPISCGFVGCCCV
jgi:hypothetical protein